jgi:hypothetical protein
MHCYTLAQLLCFLLCGLTSGSLSIGSGLIPIEPIIDRVLGNNIQTFEYLKRSRLTVCVVFGAFRFWVIRTNDRVVLPVYDRGVRAAAVRAPTSTHTPLLPLITRDGGSAS